MIEFSYRQGKTGRIAACGRTKTETTLHNVPAVVNAARAAGRLKIYFFARRLIRIGDIGICGDVIARHDDNAIANSAASGTGNDVVNIKMLLVSKVRWKSHA